MARMRRSKRDGRTSETPQVCPHCGGTIERPPEKPPKKKWYERTSVTLCVAAVLAVIGLGFVHVIVGVRSPYGLAWDLVFRESFGYRETVVNAQKIQSLPYNAARRKYPIGVVVLQREGYMESGRSFEVRTRANLRANVQQWQVEFQEALGRSEPRWQDQLQGAEQGPPADSEDARTSNQRGILFARGGDYASAISEFTRAIRKEPTFADAYHNRALVSIAIGALGQAASDFGNVIAIRPDFLEGYLRRGRLHAATNESDKAIADFTRAVEIDTRCAEAYFHRSLVHYAKGTYDEALADVRKVQNLGLSVSADYLDTLRAASGEGSPASR